MRWSVGLWSVTVSGTGRSCNHGKLCSSVSCWVRFVRNGNSVLFWGAGVWTLFTQDAGCGASGRSGSWKGGYWQDGKFPDLFAPLFSFLYGQVAAGLRTSNEGGMQLCEGREGAEQLQTLSVGECRRCV